MCGLTGVFFGKKRRRREEIGRLTGIFTRLLVMSEPRGPHATGAAWLDVKGEHRIYKRPGPAGQFVLDKEYHELIAGVNLDTTVLLGHARWPTRGDERNNANNQPKRCGRVLAHHGGTIFNADYLFKKFKLRRHAQVDSELLFRLATNAARDGRIDLARFKNRLRFCRGQITAVIACRTDPGTVLVLKGNKPLHLRWNRRMRAVLYASDPAYLDAVLAEEPGWRELPIPAMSLVVFRYEDLAGYSIEPIEFIAQERKGRIHDKIEIEPKGPGTKGPGPKGPGPNGNEPYYDYERS